MTDMQRIFAIRAYARTHDDGGWDILKEYWSNDEISRRTQGAASLEECIARVAKSLRIMDNIRDAIRHPAL
jgi:hypothetical protein